MTKIEKIRNLIDAFGFVRTDSQSAYETYEKSYEQRPGQYGGYGPARCVKMTISLDEEFLAIDDVKIDEAGDIEDMRAVAGAITDAADDFEDLYTQAEDLEDDEIE